MFEVIVTYRRDYSEEVVQRLPNREEALAVSKQLSEHQHETVVRAWVRQVRQAKTGIV